MVKPSILPMSRAFEEHALRGVPTPAFVYSETRLRQSRDLVQYIREATGSRILYAAKAMPFADILRFIGLPADGIAVSSLFEARLAHELLPQKQVHLTTPGLRSSEIREISEVCDFVSLNSINHVRVFAPQLRGNVSLGVRLNTGLPYVRDMRYNPCRPYSKLGIPLSQLKDHVTAGTLAGVRGLHIHTNADSTDLDELRANVDELCDGVPEDLGVEWINLGGGYLFDEMPSIDPLVEIIDSVRERFDAEVFLEPGAALVRRTVVLVSQVTDLFKVDGKMVAVLDSTVNHMPEVLEFDYQPDVLEQSEDGEYEYILAGSTCLAGDVFGSYLLRSELDIGSRVVFSECGAYTLVKAHRFNGVNLPSIWALDVDGTLHMRKQYTYQHYKGQWLPDA